mmetsp:Transcript_56389/g.160066  ORF Transcript_56389/g.160066 Transcript_56389/m.160066 type:complete len:1173 (-) Transcript_56389:145-3663(-)
MGIRVRPMAGDIEPATKDEPRQGHRKITWAHCPHWLSWVLVVVLVLDKAGVITLPFGVHPAEGDALGVRALKERRLGGEVLAFSGGPRQLTAGSTGDHASNYTECHGGNQDSNHTGNHAGNHTGNHSETGHGEAHSDAHTGSHTEHAHPHYTLMFLFTAFIIGAAVTHLTTFPQFHSMQFTVVLFVLGMIYSFIFSQLGVGGISGSSFDMWMAIDPHLLLYTLLPVLLMGDAMTIDTGVVRRVAGQCLYLAGPGVLIGTFATAGFLYLYFHWMRGWPFELCMTLGSILAATDPVAVVGLLKELGASPTLTIIIQGESLLNDGTAIVLYLLSYDALKGHVPDIADIVIFLIKTAGLAVFAGICIGWFFCLWIRAASSRFNHNSTTIQICLTLCCAYTSFFMAEAVFEISGVLSCVAAALVLADNMWPSIVHKEALEEVWHMFEYLGNSLIFFLAGAKVGQSAQDIVWQDFFHLLLIYVVCVLIRGTMIFASRPLLKWLSKDRIEVSMADAAVMTWGGLRGAVGLALAMQVSLDRADNSISEDLANSALFYTGGIAALTLIVNATTSPALVQALGLTKTGTTRKQLLLDVHKQLEKMATDDANYTHDVQRMLGHVLGEVKTEITEGEESNNLGDRPSARKAFVYRMTTKAVQMPRTENILELHDRARNLLRKLPEERWWMLLKLPESVVTEKEQAMRRQIEEAPQNLQSQEMLKAVHEVFLSMVRSQYWEQIESGAFVVGTNESDVLLHSVVFALHHSGQGLLDFGHLATKMRVESFLDDHFVDEETEVEFAEMLRASQVHPEGQESLRSVAAETAALGSAGSCRAITKRIIDSMVFHAFMTVVILVNSVIVVLEDYVEGDQSSGRSNAFVILEVLFATVFMLEFVMKLFVLHMKYFKSKWNCFDFFLVVLSIPSLILEFSSWGKGVPNAQVLHLTHSLRVLRMLRLVRLARFCYMAIGMLRRKRVSLKLAEHVEQITVLMAFAQAHLHAQVELLRYFGGVPAQKGVNSEGLKTEGLPRRCEVSRCLMESQTSVYKALAICLRAAGLVDKKVLMGMDLLRSTGYAAEELVKFVERARDVGALSSKEAEGLVHPMMDHEQRVHKLIKDEHFGIRRKTVEDIGEHVEASPVDIIKARSSFLHGMEINAVGTEGCPAAVGSDPARSDGPSAWRRDIV